MTLVNGVLTGKIDIVPADWFTVRQPQTVAETRNKIHCWWAYSNLKVAYGRLDTRKNFYTVRAPRPWNSVPSEIKGMSKQEKFKKSNAKWKNGLERNR